jgi:2-polyprenyl-3-methyl-5-hydroxy-6-metoxy-1,4-benzoquinol methylase
MDLVEKRVNGAVPLRHPWEDARYHFFKRKIAPLLSLQQQLCIYDIGCGDAYFLANLCREFPNIKGVGVDINFTGQDIIDIKETYRLPNLSVYRTIDEARQEHHQVDLILLMDVIEHIEHDQHFLSELITPIMRPDGTLLFLTVPAYQSLFTRHDVFLKHFRRYDNESLRRTIVSSGLAVCEIGYFFTSLVPLRVLEKMRDRWSGKHAAEGLANWDKGPFVTKTLKSMLILDTKISGMLRRLGVKMPGLSNYIICKK